MSKIMPNYGVFTQNCVLQEFRKMEQKRKKKQQEKQNKWLRQEMQLCHNVITALSRQNPKATSKTVSQQRQSKV